MRNEQARGFTVALGLLIAAVVFHLAWITAQRVVYPWDFYIWSESPFLTNLLKISQGLSPYSSPADANSFVYSTGLLWLTSAVLQPFGLALDIRYCRVVSIAFGLTACAFGAAAISRAVSSLVASDTPRFARASVPLHFGVLVLVLFMNFTADVVHPDNLHVFHAVVTFLLGLIALDSGRLRWAAAAMAWAGLGVLTKQTEALAFLGLSLAFALSGPWTFRERLLLPVIGLLSSGLSLAALWWSPDARTYTLDVLLLHPRSLAKIVDLAQDLAVPHRALLLLLTVPALRYLYAASPAGRRHVALWLATFAFSCLPNLSAYFKAMGTWNNLGILDFWMALAVWPVLYDLATDSGRASLAVRWSGRAAALALVLTLVTHHVPPSASDYAVATRLENLLRADRAAGRRVLVANGTSALLRSGYTEVPLDRAYSVVELNVAGLGDRAGMLSRIRHSYYDRIYLNLNWYGPEIDQEIRRHYQRRDFIAGTGAMDFARGFQGLLMDGSEILDRRDARALSLGTE